MVIKIKEVIMKKLLLILATLALIINCSDDPVSTNNIDPSIDTAYIDVAILGQWKETTPYLNIITSSHSANLYWYLSR